MILGDLILGANVLGAAESVAIDQGLPATILGTVTYPVTGEQGGVYSGQAAGLATITPAPQTVGGASTDTTVFTPASVNFYAQSVAFSINSNTYTQFSAASVNFYAQNLNSAQYSVSRTVFSAADFNFYAQNLAAYTTDNKLTQFIPASFGFYFHDFQSVQVTSTSTAFTPAQISFYSQLYIGFQPTSSTTAFTASELGFFAQSLSGSGIILGNPKYIFDLKYSVKSFDYIL